MEICKTPCKIMRIIHIEISYRKTYERFMNVYFYDLRKGASNGIFRYKFYGVQKFLFKIKNVVSDIFI